MTCFVKAKTSPNMIGLTVKNIIIKKQLNFVFKVPGVLFCTIYNVPPSPVRTLGQKRRQSKSCSII